METSHLVTTCKFFIKKISPERHVKTIFLESPENAGIFIHGWCQKRLEFYLQKVFYSAKLSLLVKLNLVQLQLLNYVKINKILKIY